MGAWGEKSFGNSFQHPSISKHTSSTTYAVPWFFLQIGRNTSGKTSVLAPKCPQNTLNSIGLACSEEARMGETCLDPLGSRYFLLCPRAPGFWSWENFIHGTLILTYFDSSGHYEIWKGWSSLPKGKGRVEGRTIGVHIFLSSQIIPLMIRTVCSKSTIGLQLKREISAFFIIITLLVEVCLWSVSLLRWLKRPCFELQNGLACPKANPKSTMVFLPAVLVIFCLRGAQPVVILLECTFN